MKKIICVLISFLILKISISQPLRIAILDFDNLSGIAKYDGLGKAMSSMLISDIESNVSPKRLQLVERAQINKIMKEQNFQASKVVDKTTSVKAGKLLGVKYLLVGDIYMLKDLLVINARLTDIETGDIKFSKKQEGKLVEWLALKTFIAKELSKSISMPFSEPNMPDKELNMATITTFGNAITAKDEGDINKAETLAETLLDINPELSYIKNLKDELDDIKKELAKINEKIDDALDNPEELAVDLINRNSEIKKAINYLDIANSKIDYYSKFGVTKDIFIHQQKAKAYYRLGDFKTSQAHYDSCIAIDKNFLLAHYVKMSTMMGGEFANIPQGVTVLNPDKDYMKEILADFDFITSYNKSNISSFNKSVYRAPYLNDDEKCNNNPSSKECDFFSYAIELPRKNGATVFDDLLRDIDIWNLYNHITYPTNEVCRYLISRKENKLAIQILENSISQQFEFLERLPGYSYYHKSNRDFNLIKKSNPFIVGDNSFKYYKLISNYHNYLIEENSTTSKSIFDNILLLGELYLQNNQPYLGIKLIDDFRLISQKINSKKEGNAFLLAYFKFYIKQLFLLDLSQKKSEKEFKKCSNIYDSIKSMLPNYFLNSDLDFKSYYTQQLQIEKNLYTKENIEILNKYLIDNLKNIDFSNKNYATVEEVDNYYDYNNQNKTLMLHAYADSIYESKDYSKDFYTTIDCTDGFTNNIITINVNKHFFEDACLMLESSLNKNKKITILLSLNENGKINLLDLEIGWLNYNEINFSSKILYTPDDFGTLFSNDLNKSLQSCLGNLSNSNNELYNQGIVLCFKEIGLEKSFQLLKNNSFLLNNLSWAIANSNLSSNQDLIIAAKMAERASYIVFDTDHNILDTYSFTLLKIGQKDKSKSILNKAIETARNINDIDSIRKYEEKLKAY